MVFCYQHTSMSVSLKNILNYLPYAEDMSTLQSVFCVHFVVFFLFREHYNDMLTEHICVSVG
jgi:hypothetical protein